MKLDNQRKLLEPESERHDKINVQLDVLSKKNTSVIHYKNDFGHNFKAIGTACGLFAFVSASMLLAPLDRRQFFLIDFAWPLI